jgi:hypothetical protein
MTNPVPAWLAFGSTYLLNDARFFGGTKWERVADDVRVREEGLPPSAFFTAS